MTFAPHWVQKEDGTSVVLAGAAVGVAVGAAVGAAAGAAGATGAVDFTEETGVGDEDGVAPVVLRMYERSIFSIA